MKSELILHKGLTENCFVTRNRADKGDWVTVRIAIIGASEPETSTVQTTGSIQTKESVQPEEKETTTASTSQPTSQPSATDLPEITAADKRKASPDKCGLALRANLLRWATLTPDLGVEWRINRNWGVLVNGAWTSWSWDNKNRRYALWNVSPEIHYYIGKEKRGYLGVMYQLGEFNYKFGDTGKQGDYKGGGITGGYVLPIGKCLALDFSLGLGYTRADFEKYMVTDGVRVRQGNGVKNYWGVNKAGVTLVWKLF